MSQVVFQIFQFKDEIFKFYIDNGKKKIYTLDVDEMDMVY
mgnify:FL=1